MILGLAIIAILSLGFVAYASLNPQRMTVTQQQFLTNTQNQYVTQTVTSVSTVTNLATVTTSAGMITVSTANGYIGSGYSGYYNCGNYGCSLPSLGTYGNLCQSTSGNGTVQCSGYLSEPTDGCIELAIPYTNPDLLESTAYQWYTLRNVPSTLPSGGSWVTVTGQLYQGYTPGTNGGACPGTYINVNSITP